jgi:glycosyltransferase involved in cell wall biosynthesis
MPRLLVVTSGLYFDPTDIPTQLRYKALSMAGFSGCILCVIYDKRLKNEVIGNFELIPLYLPGFLQGYGEIEGVVRALYYSLFCAWKGIAKKRKYDACIASDTFKTGLLCYLISLFTRKPYIVEVAGNYIRSYDVKASEMGLVDRFKQGFVKKVSPFVLRHADAVKLLYESQLDGLAVVDEQEKIRVFHDTTALDEFHASDVDEKFILSIGRPWHLKGMDILIRAFRKIQNEIPDYRLFIIGYNPDISEYEELAQGDSRIIFHNKGFTFDRIIEQFMNCSLFVLASRSEGMGRVLLEAMASRKPIIASRVDGIPRVITDGQNGLLFESENVDELAEKMLLLLSDRHYANELAERGLLDVHERFSIQVFIDKYKEMVNYALEH